jgi:hypothetical protein
LPRARPRALGAGGVAALPRARLLALAADLLAGDFSPRAVGRALLDFGCVSASERSDAERLPGGLLVTTAVGRS